MRRKESVRRRRYFTLLEVMIVIFLIGLIGGVVSYSMRGTLNEGKAFKTEQAIARIQDILELEIASGTPIDVVRAHPLDVLAASGVVKDPRKLAVDGWGKPLELEVTDAGQVRAFSQGLQQFRAKKGRLRHEGSEGRASLDEYAQEDEE